MNFNTPKMIFCTKNILIASILLSIFCCTLLPYIYLGLQSNDFSDFPLVALTIIAQVLAIFFIQRSNVIGNLITIFFNLQDISFLHLLDQRMSLWLLKTGPQTYFNLLMSYLLIMLALIHMFLVVSRFLRQKRSATKK